MSARTAATFWHRVWMLVRPSRRRLVVVAGCVLAASLADVGPALIIRQLVDQNLLRHRSDGVALAAALYLLIVMADAVLTFTYGYLSATVAQKAITDVRIRMFEHLTRTPIAYFDRTPLGEVISRATSDVETVDDLFTEGIATLIGQLAPLVTVAGTMIVLSPPLALVSALVVPPLVLMLRWLQRRVRQAERATRVAIGRVNAELAEFLGGAKTIRIFGRELVFAQRFRGTLGQTLRAQSSSAAYNAFFAPVTNLTYAVAVGALLYVGAAGSLARLGISLGTLIAFILLFQGFFAPIVALGEQWQSVQSAIAGAERVFELLDLEADPEPAAGSGSAVLPPQTVISVHDVTHGYEDGVAVLSGVSLAVNFHEHVAIVGRTGAGKSTLVTLLGGLTQPWSGTVSICGRNPHLLTDQERRLMLGVVPQPAQMFTASVAENVTLGNPEISRGEVEDALSLVGAAELIEQLPDGIDTVLAGSSDGRGLQLSAGQRQLIALARALVARPAAVVLDEATAAIDSASEASVRLALQSVLREERGGAVVTIAHRLATARSADRILVLDNGRVVEQGTPAELIRGGGRFAALLALEEAGWSWAEAVDT